MSIQVDAGKILKEVYHIYTSNNQDYQVRKAYEQHNIKLPLTTSKNLKEKIKIDDQRLENALNYLIDKKLIDTKKVLDEIWVIKIQPSGIKTVENRWKFIRSFGFGVFGFSFNIER